MATERNKNIRVVIILFAIILILVLFWVFGGNIMTKNFVKKVMFGNDANMTCDAGEKMVGLNASGAICTFDYGSYSGGGGGIGQEFDPLWSINYTYFNNSWSTTFNSTVNTSLNNYIILQNQSLNNWTTLQNNSLVNYVGIQNQSILNWITNTFNVTLNNYITFVNTSMRNYVDATFCKITGCQINGNLNITGSLNITQDLHVDGNVSMKRPYGTFTDMNIQTVPVINTAYNMSFNFTEDTYLIRKYPDNYTFTTPISGDYLIQISIIAQTVTPGDRIYIWVRHNNIDIPRSATLYDFKSSNANTVIAVPFIIDLEANDNFSIQYAGTATDIKIISFNRTAFAPETPGAIMTISKISEITD